MEVPSRKEAETLLAEAQTLNPGPWVSHSIFVAEAAVRIAAHHPLLDPEIAFSLGSLHDIGRRAGISGMRHILDGYQFMQSNGFRDAARICLTHAFPIKDIAYYVNSDCDCSSEEIGFIKKYLFEIEYSEYDRLIQLCDALALPAGICLMEKRLLDVSMRYGTNEYSIPRWKAYLGIQQDFEQAIGCSIYRVLPGVVETTFGFDPGG
jgi:hypothetical protein